MKQCTKCKEEKELTEFHKKSESKDGHNARCKACVKLHHQKWYAKNREKVIAGQKKYVAKNREKVKKYRSQYRAENKEKNAEYHRGNYIKNKEKILTQTRKYKKENKEKVSARTKRYSKNNREKINENKRKYKKKRRETDPVYALTCVLRSRLNEVIKGQTKAATTMALLGCTVEEVKKFLQNQFVEGMSWDNRGTAFHIDHMVPCASFDLSDAEQQRRCFHFTNLQPLFASENMSKGNKNIYGPYMKWEGDQWHIKINGEYMPRSRQVHELIPTRYFYPIKWMLLRVQLKF
jgi:hypothetical protein